MFPIAIVPAGAAEFSEQMGTKFKFWFQDEAHGLTLFKEGRPGTGENWAEKIAAELAELLGIPHAHYELAEWRSKQGVISPSLVPNGGRLIHGNELVGGKVTIANGNAQVRFYAQRNHIASRVFQFLKQSAEIIRPPETYSPIDGVDSALGVFIGYILFDAWIANQDRHSENWGLIKTTEGFYLAPSYDHGSSMGRHETDVRRQTMLTTKDKGASIESYICKARSALYPNAAGDNKVKAYLTSELFQIACKMDPVAGQAWRDRLADITGAKINAVIDEIPDAKMSGVAREFTARLLKLNLDRLIALEIP